MPRIVVQSDSSPMPKGATSLEERVDSDLLSRDRAAACLVERVGWAIIDAEETDRRPAASRRR